MIKEDHVLALGLSEQEHARYKDVAGAAHDLERCDAHYNEVADEDRHDSENDAEDRHGHHGA